LLRSKATPRWKKNALKYLVLPMWLLLVKGIDPEAIRTIDVDNTKNGSLLSKD